MLSNITKMTNLTNESSRIVPENELETRIVSSEVFKLGSSFLSNGDGHPEKEVYKHIKTILDFIDRQSWQEYRTDLRRLALLHDLGKYKVQHDSMGNILGDPHGIISQEIAKDFTNDPALLYAIKIHDKYFGFYKSFLRGKFREDKFLQVFADTDLDFLRRFNYADSNSREKESIVWFEDFAFDKGLIANKLYLEDPKLLL